MKVIPETIELDESDIVAAIKIYLVSIDKAVDVDSFNITLNGETKQFPNPHMTGGMADWSQRVIITATAVRV